MIRKTKILVVGIVAVLTIAGANVLTNLQKVELPLKLYGYEKVTSFSVMMEYLTEFTKNNQNFTLEIIGQSVDGRDIPLIHRIPKESDKIKVMVFAQQHGNEPSGKEALLMLLDELANSEINPLDNIDLYLVPLVNPDGNESAKRMNANKFDLNRDHLLLTQPETIALHKAARKINPLVTLDVHEYSAYRKSFLNAGFIRSVEAQFGAPTHPNISKKIIDYSLYKLFPFLELDLKNKGISFSNYYKMNSPTDTIRSSTSGIRDGRQSFAIRNLFSFILEGRNGMDFNSDLKRRSHNQLEAIKSFLSFVDSNSKEIYELVETENNKICGLTDPIDLLMDYEFDGITLPISMKTVNTDLDTTIDMFYRDRLKVIDSVSRPKGYLIPAEQRSIINILDRHGIEYKRLEKETNFTAEIYSVSDIKKRKLEDKIFKVISCSTREEKINAAKGDVIVYLNKPNANFLAILLEPSSMWGLAQYDEFSDSVKKEKDYPVVRIYN